ncbi:MAG: AmmeMemoRadiSam system protein B [Planctomycetota bacterium]
MRIREAIVAGRFYPSTRVGCEEAIAEMSAKLLPPSVNERVVGGLVPHAGWVYSGAVTANVFKTLAVRQVSVVVLVGGVHRYRGKEAALFGSGRWETPLGTVEVDDRLAERVLGHTNLIVDDPYAHEEEHSIEVQVPFVQHFFPGARILPIMVPARATAPEVGEAIGRTLTCYGYDALIIGTTDLTHYGPNYGFVPKGVGVEANRWAKDENDRRFIDRVCSMQTQSLVSEASTHKNACSSGAAAATVAAASKLAAKNGILLDQTCSSEMASELGESVSDDSVGYAGIVFIS